MSNETINKIFLEIIPSYMLFYNQKRYDTVYKVNLYDCFELVLTWKKCYRYFIKTTINLLNNYKATEEDMYILKELSDMVKGDTILKMTKWYKQQCKLNKLDNNLTWKV